MKLLTLHLRARSDTTPPPSSRSRLGALTEESETAHRLFDNARLPAELSEAAGSGGAGSAGAGPAAAAAEGAAVDALESTALGRVFSAIGNTLFFGSVAAASFFGYYTYRYDVDQVGAGCSAVRVLGSRAQAAGKRRSARASCPALVPCVFACLLQHIPVLCSVFSLPHGSELCLPACCSPCPPPGGPHGVGDGGQAGECVCRQLGEAGSARGRGGAPSSKPGAKPSNRLLAGSYPEPSAPALPPHAAWLAVASTAAACRPPACPPRPARGPPPARRHLAAQVWVPVMKWYAQQRRHLEGEMKKYADPPSDRLLPDLPPSARHIKTLVLDLDDVLVHSDWTRGRWVGVWVGAPCAACRRCAGATSSSGRTMEGSTVASAADVPGPGQLPPLPSRVFTHPARSAASPLKGERSPAPAVVCAPRGQLPAREHAPPPPRAPQGLAHLQAAGGGGLHPQHGAVLRAGGVHQPAAHLRRPHPRPARPAAHDPVQAGRGWGCWAGAVHPGAVGLVGWGGCRATAARAGGTRGAASPGPCCPAVSVWLPVPAGPTLPARRPGPPPCITGCQAVPSRPAQAVPRQHAVRGRQARARPVQAEPGHAPGAARSPGQRPCTRRPPPPNLPLRCCKAPHCSGGIVALVKQLSFQASPLRPQAGSGRLWLLPPAPPQPTCGPPPAPPPLQVLFITADPDAFALQPENAVKVGAPMLRHLAPPLLSPAARRRSSAQSGMLAHPPLPQPRPAPSALSAAEQAVEGGRHAAAGPDALPGGGGAHACEAGPATGQPLPRCNTRTPRRGWRTMLRRLAGSPVSPAAGSVLRCTSTKHSCLCKAQAPQCAAPCSAPGQARPVRRRRAAPCRAHACAPPAQPRVPLPSTLCVPQVPDVRDVVKSYEGQDIPTAFRERMKRVQDQQAARQQQQKGFLGGIARR